jgi:sulfite reductase (NADPH) flavoprotein alpha-component
MNAMTQAGSPVIPENAPFSPAQRAWLNGFLAGLYGGTAGGDAGMSVAGSVAAEEEEFPWHDPALEMDERLALAEDRPFERKLMAAMAQLDCGQCGYLCQTYAEALASGRETSPSLCVPGSKPTSKKVKELLAERPADSVAMAPPAAESPAPTIPLGMPVRVMAADRLTGDTSAKDVRHVKIDLSPSGMTYEPGDSIGICAPNDPELVEACLRAIGAAGDELVPCPDGTMRTARDAFAWQVDIARPLDRTLDLLAMSATDPGEAAAIRRLADGDDGAEPADADLLDLLEAFPSARPRLFDLVKSLPSLKPRLYSIASSIAAEPGQVHLCVSVVKAMRRGRLRHGIASSFLAHRAAVHGQILANIQKSHFRLPADPATPVIMVGPGTGIAPFRAFLQERAVQKHPGKTWLFFGDQHEASDFLFGDQLQAWRAAGVLSRLDTAWSRDQAKKVYVQDRMRENAADLWHWLQDGAHFYVCGDAMRMAKDVDAALRDVAMTQGGLDEAQAKDWTVSLARQGRYLRDVY